MPDEAEFVRVGQIVGTHGVKGAVRVRPLTDFLERFDPGQTLFLKGAPRKVVRRVFVRDQVRVQLEGVVGANEAEALKWEYLFVPKASLPSLTDGEYLTTDLVGCAVVDEQGTVLGRLDKVVSLPAHDVFQVGESMIPAVKEFIREVDLKQRKIVVRLIPGLLDPSEAEQ